MKAIDRRVAALERVKPEMPLLRMTDAQLIRIVTNGQSDTVTDEELEQIAAGEAWGNSKNAKAPTARPGCASC